MQVELILKFVTKVMANACVRKDMMGRDVIGVHQDIMVILTVALATAVILAAHLLYVMPVESVPALQTSLAALVTNVALDTTDFLSV